MKKPKGSAFLNKVLYKNKFLTKVWKIFWRVHPKISFIFFFFCVTSTSSSGADEEQNTLAQFSAGSVDVSSDAKLRKGSFPEWAASETKKIRQKYFSLYLKNDTYLLK